MSWDDDDQERRALVLRVAGEALTTAQFRCLVLHFFAGWSEGDIARHYDCAQPSVHEAIWGQRKSAGGPKIGGAIGRIRSALASAEGGAVSKLGKAIETDPELAGILNALKEAPQMQAAPTRPTPLGWFRNARVHDVDALAVLLVMSHLADKAGRLHINQLVEEVPRSTLGTALSKLRVLGFVQTDGVSITIIKTPAPLEESHA